MSQIVNRLTTSTAIVMLLYAGAEAGAQPVKGGLPPVPIPPPLTVKPDMRPVGPPPTEVTVAPNDPFTITVKWTRAQGSAGSRVYLSTMADSGFRPIYSDSVPGIPADANRPIGPVTFSRSGSTPAGTGGNTIDTRSPIMPAFAATKLQPGSTFYLKAAAWYSDGREGRSPPVAATTPPPPPPPNLKATVQMRTVTLAWEPAPNAVAYRVVRNGQRIAELVPTTAFGNTSLKTSYTDVGESNASYTYQVHAVYTYALLPERVGIATVALKTPWTFCVTPTRQ
jgi:hypothetical protein